MGEHKKTMDEGLLAQALVLNSEKTVRILKMLKLHKCNKI